MTAGEAQVRPGGATTESRVPRAAESMLIPEMREGSVSWHSVNKIMVYLDVDSGFRCHVKLHHVSSGSLYTVYLLRIGWTHDFHPASAPRRHEIDVGLCVAASRLCAMTFDR